MRDGFAEYHPIVNMLFFVTVIGTAMFVMHPIYSGISFVAAAAYHIYLKGRNGLMMVAAMIPLFLLTSLINPLFSHEGVTLICYLPTGNPLTLESILYGLVSGLMIVTVVMWFSAFNCIMTEDKILCVAGELFPSLGMVISMVLRFIPKFSNQAKKVVNANKALGVNEVGKGAHLRKGMKVFGIMTTWSLENSVITADSMKARGYGSGKRTSFTMYCFTVRDGILLGIIGILFLWDIWILTSGNVDYSFYPTFHMVKAKGIYEYIGIYGSHMILCFLPLFVHLKEDVKWHRLQSKR